MLGMYAQPVATRSVATATFHSAFDAVRASTFEVGGEEDSAPPGTSMPASRPWVEAVESGVAVRHARTV
jgi:hypothetical protein